MLHGIFLEKITPSLSLVLTLTNSKKPVVFAHFSMWLAAQNLSIHQIVTGLVDCRHFVMRLQQLFVQLMDILPAALHRNRPVHLAPIEEAC